MNKDLTLKLNSDYPEIFSGLRPGLFSFEHDDGWYGLVDSLCDVLVRDVRAAHSQFIRYRDRVGQPLNFLEGGSVITQDMVDQAEKQWLAAQQSVPKARQIKEKYGTLCIYVSQATPEQRAVIEFAENMSARVCEKCGSMDKVKTYLIGWSKTLCPVHALEQYGPKFEQH